MTFRQIERRLSVKTLSQAALLCVGLAFLLTAMPASAQSIDVGGGTLSYTVSSSGSVACGISPNTYIDYQFSSFSFTNPSHTQWLTGYYSADYYSWNGQCADGAPQGAVPGSLRLNGNGFYITFYPGDYGSGSAVYTAVTVPAISGISPTSGPVETSVTITGSNFGDTPSTVTFNGASAPVSSWNNTQIVASVPNEATTGSVVVTTTNGSATGPSFTVTVGPTTSAQSIDVGGGTLSYTVSSSGSVACGISPNTYIDYQFSSFSFTNPSHTQSLTGYYSADYYSWNGQCADGVAQGAVPGSLRLNGNGFYITFYPGDYGSGSAVYTALPGPTISGISPTSGPVETSVTITGSNFGDTPSTVTFNGTSATVSSWNKTQIVASVPNGATTGSVVVTTTNGSATGPTFTVTVGPTISSIAPTSGWVGTWVTISGSNFGATQGSSTIWFNGTTATPSFWSERSIVAQVPGGATTGSVVVTTTGGSGTGPTFTVTPSSGSNIVGRDYVTTYAYDALGNLTNVTQVGDSASVQRTRQFQYNSLGQLTSAHNPESGPMTIPITYRYDANGNLIGKVSLAPNQIETGQQQQTICYHYDELNRLTGKKYLAGDQSSICPSQSTWDISYSYDQGNDPVYGNAQIGYRTGMQDLSGSSTWTYDTMGRMSWETRIIHGVPADVTKLVKYSYQLDGQVQTVTYPSGNVLTYDYDLTTGRPTAAHDTADRYYVSNATYWPQGSVYQMNYGSTAPAINLETDYNSRLQLSLIKANFSPSNPILDLNYDYVTGTPGNNGNVMKITDGVNASRTQTLSYDALNRLQTAYTDGGIYGDQYSIDGWGNLVEIHEYNGRPASRAVVQPVNPDNRVIGLTHDAPGNVINDLNHRYTYDAENQIVQVDANLTYLYNGDGQRVGKSSPYGRLYWAGSSADALAESDLAGVLTSEYVYFNGKRVARIDADNSVHYYIGDVLGSTRLVCRSGACEEDDFYSPFGVQLQGSNGLNHYKFTGKERDSETGLDYFGARYYASNMGRWTSPDPINLTRARLVNPSNTLNKYAYAANNPLKYVDRDGEDITIFYRPAGLSPTDWGHIFIAALNQKTGQVGFLDYYPRGGGNGPGQFNLGDMQDRAANSGQFATLTIQTTPEQAQKVLDLITRLTTGNPPDYAALSNNCTTICQDVLHDLGLDFGDVFPDDYWAHVYRNFSPAVQDNPFKAFFVPYNTGLEYGNPRSVGTNFTQLLFQIYLNQWNQQQQKQKPPRACVDAHDDKGNSTGKTCTD